MRLIVLLLILALFSSGYCAAAHAFGEIPMQGRAGSAVMMNMTDCPGMQAATPDEEGGHHPAKADGMNCKACCASLIGFPAFVIGRYIVDGILKFPVYDNTAQSDLRFRIFHPPKSPV